MWYNILVQKLKGVYEIMIMTKRECQRQEWRREAIIELQEQLTELESKQSLNCVERLNMDAIKNTIASLKASA